MSETTEQVYAERLARELDGIDVRVCDDPAAAVEGAELIVTATTSREPVFPGGALAEGAHINAVGTFSHEGCEIEGEVVLRSRLVVDSREAALREAGDIRVRIAEGLFGPDHIDAELGEIVGGTRPRGRMGHAFTLFKSVGSAAQDLAVAAEILRVAEREGLGTIVEL
jgi:ornithine cyclodeaminase/alanine dehydrogenase-like protein (mu-crystallin family)